MTNHRTLSAQASCWIPERGDWLREVRWGASLLFFLSFIFFSSLCLFLRSSSLKTLLFHSLPLTQTPSKTAFLSPPRPLRSSTKHNKDPRNSTTKYSIQTNLPASLLQTSTQYKPQEPNENTKTECKPK